jgi:hypothetical protein
MTNVTMSRDESFGPARPEAQFEAILERVLRAYHANEGHGGADWIRGRILDAEPCAGETSAGRDRLRARRCVHAGPARVLVLSDGKEIYIFQGDAYRLGQEARECSRRQRRQRAVDPQSAPIATHLINPGHTINTSTWRAWTRCASVIAVGRTGEGPRRTWLHQ